MLINRKYVRSLDGYLGGLIPLTEIRFVTDLSHVAAPKLATSGFSSLVDGDILLPPIIGRKTRLNAEGSCVVHRDQPKERRLIGRREWTREEWAGGGQTRTVTEEVDIYRDCYPRTFVPPLGVELTVAAHGSTTLAVSPPVTWDETPPENILHIINMMLELFGEVEVRHENLTSFLPPNTRRVNWTLLPPGNTLAGVSAHVAALITRTAASSRPPIMSRLTFLASRNPTEVYLGHGGFHAYVAYVFPATGMTILESVKAANATYVFRGNWQTVSHLTKSQILAGSHNHDRIIHDGGWEARLRVYAR